LDLAAGTHDSPVPLLWQQDQTEIAELMNLSQMHVSRLITRTLAALQAELLKVHG
jgi:DNA-directed RNA polymerase specialized sigma subunit